jgi:hypothetical protein
VQAQVYTFLQDVNDNAPMRATIAIGATFFIIIVFLIVTNKNWLNVSNKTNHVVPDSTKVECTQSGFNTILVVIFDKWQYG